MYYVYIYRDPRPEKSNAVVYVGMGKNNRAWDHLRHSTNKRLNALIKKLQRDNYDVNPVLMFENLTKEQAIEKEIELIRLYGRADLQAGTLFNLTAGGEGTAELNVESLAKRAANIKATFSTPEGRKKQSDRATKFWQSAKGELTKLEFSELCKTEEFKANLKQAWQEKGGHSDESKAKIGEASRIIMQDETYKSQWLELQKQGCNTPEALSKKSEAVKKGWQNEETRRKRTEGIAKSRSTDESRAKTRAQQEQQWTDDAKKKASDFAKERLKDPLTKIRSRVANAYNWCKRQGRPYSEVTFDV